MFPGWIKACRAQVRSGFADMHKIKDLKAQKAKVATRFEHFADKWNRLTSAQMR
jgi:hypothetical protein